MKSDNLDIIIKKVVELSESWQNRAVELLTPEEKDIREQMRRLLVHPMDKVVLAKLIDQSFRSHNPGRVADQINSLIREYGVPTFFSAADKLLLQMFRGIGRHLPELSVPRVIDKMRRDSRRVILPGEKEWLHLHLQKRKKEGVGMNLNRLGEAVLGETEARSRLQVYIADLMDSQIECISVKISTLYSQINPLAFADTVAVLRDRLVLLFKTADQHYFTRNDGHNVKKSVHLDMEAYRDMEITAAAFSAALEDASLFNHTAGIALQAYLPDAFGLQQKLTEWAHKRVAAGGAPIRIRIVKGANLEMERVEAAIQGWPQAPYDDKRDVDANYKRMVAFGLDPENIRAVHLGIASHNLFDLAYACRLARLRGVADAVTVEMLEGMADHVARAVRESGEKLLMYAPVAAGEQFINAIAYLIRRLDENTSRENFLRYAGGLSVDSKEWDFLKHQFIDALRHRDEPRQTPHRVQNRGSESFNESAGTFFSGEFSNEPDTDWSLAANREWAKRIRDKWKKRPDETPMQIPVVVGGRKIFGGRRTIDCMDISQLPESVCVARHALAEDEDVDQALRTAKADPDEWRRLTHPERYHILSNAARELRRARGDLIGAAAANTGKIFTESDPEVSEAIDFAEFYPFAAKTFHDLENLNCRGKGVGVVISPWNFPIAIPCGGILAALAAGNTVIFKPASAAVLVGWELCQTLWKAGVSRNVLQFLPCSGNRTGTRLTRHPDVDFIIFTGGTETGLSILKEKPALFLAAETGGKNATIVTAMADRDQAVRNVIHSAFSNSGQKCSATSLLILEDEVYRDKGFKRQLLDAAKSLAVGSAWDFANRMGPLIHPPAGDLLQALTRLEPGESWALKPENIRNNPCLWTPGIKWGVKPGSYTYLTEFFGPLLGVMRADNLDHAIELANGTGYGLTSAIETLDNREQKRWIDAVQAGNLYINRGTTGAVVLRQPFGGMKKSVLGAGIKAGFHNYVAQFMQIEDTRLPPVDAIQNDHFLLRQVQEWQQKIDREEYKPIRSDLYQTIRAVKSCLYRYEQEFSRQKDYFHLRGQDNIIRYRPVGRIVIRLHPQDTLFEVLARIAAAGIAGCRTVISIPPDLENPVTAFLQGRDGRKFSDGITVAFQTDAELIAAMPAVERIRYAAPERASAAVLAEAARTGFYVARTPVLMEGRVELLHYFTEQSICNTYHRYGNLGERALIR